jgi:hypothetical protein
MPEFHIVESYNVRFQIFLDLLEFLGGGQIDDCISKRRYTFTTK